MRRKPLGFEEPNVYELLRSINYEIGLEETSTTEARDITSLYALRRVLELHKPITAPDGLVVCKANCEGDYPCPTIQAIENELS